MMCISENESFRRPERVYNVRIQYNLSTKIRTCAHEWSFPYKEIQT